MEVEVACFPRSLSPRAPSVSVGACMVGVVLAAVYRQSDPMLMQSGNRGMGMGRVQFLLGKYPATCGAEYWVRSRELDSRKLSRGDRGTLFRSPQNRQGRRGAGEEREEEEEEAAAEKGEEGGEGEGEEAMRCSSARRQPS